MSEPDRTIPRCVSCRRTDVNARDVCPEADGLECHETASVNVILREEPPSASAARAKAARLTGSPAVAMHCAEAYRDEAVHAPQEGDCPNCDGKGWVKAKPGSGELGIWDCPDCEGSGSVPEPSETPAWVGR